MKKMITLLLALALVLGAAMTYADEGTDVSEPLDTITVSWLEVAPEVEAMGLPGEFYTLKGLQVGFWVPSTLKPVELETTWDETGYLAAFKTESERGFYISFYELPVDGVEAFAELVDKVEGKEGQALVVNGLSAYSFELEDMLHVAFLVSDGYILSFDFYPSWDYVFSAMARVIVASVQTYDQQGAE